MKLSRITSDNICHKKPERSFVVKGVQSFFCQRCIGIYLGFLFGICFMLLTGSFYIGSMDISVLIFLLPMMYDGVTQTLRRRESNNMFRYTTGLLFGFGLAPLLGLAEFGVEFPAVTYSAFVLLLTVFMMLLKKQFGEKSVVFVKAVSWLSVVSIFAMWVVLPLFFVRVVLVLANIVSSFLVF